MADQQRRRGWEVTTIAKRWAPVVATVAPGTAPCSPAPLLPWPSPTSRPQPGRPTSPGLPLVAPASEFPTRMEPWRCALTVNGYRTRCQTSNAAHLDKVSAPQPGRTFVGNAASAGVTICFRGAEASNHPPTAADRASKGQPGHCQGLHVHPGCRETPDGSKARPGPSWAPRDGVL